MSIEAAQVLEQAVTQIANNNGVAGTAPAKTEAAATEPKVDPQVSSKLEVLARREQAALAAERAATARAKEADEKFAKVNEFESIKTKNPKKALELLGLSYDDLTKVELLDGEVPPEVQIKKLKEELDSFKNSQTQKEKDQAEAAKQEALEQETKAISEFKAGVHQFLTDNSERYELIQFEGQQDLVFEVIDEHYNRTQAASVKEIEAAGGDTSKAVGKVMTKAEAADKVEAWLEQKYDKSRTVKKVIALMGLRQESKKPEVKQETTNRQPPKTLTNQISATQTKPRTQPITDEERVQRAIAYAKGLRT